MPNWVSNAVTVKGTVKDIKDFMLPAYKQFNIDESTELVDVVKIVNSYADEQKNLHLSSWLPVPEDFHIEVDTTNCPEQYPELVEYQKEHYGVVGWYDYYIKYYGVKWDSSVLHIEMYGVKESDDIILLLDLETPWNIPYNWLENLSSIYTKLEFYNKFYDEMMNFFGWIDFYNHEEKVIYPDDVEDFAKNNEFPIADYLDDDGCEERTEFTPQEKAQAALEYLIEQCEFEYDDVTNIDTERNLLN